MEVCSLFQKLAINELRSRSPQEMGQGNGVTLSLKTDRAGMSRKSNLAMLHIIGRHIHSLNSEEQYE